MDMKDRDWFLILDNHSTLSKSSGAYKLDTIMNFKEMNTLSKYSKH